MRKSKKSVTIDDLAIMVAKGFSRTDEQFAKMEEKSEKKFQDVEGNFKKVRNDILNIGDKFVPRHEFDSFLVRYHRLEQKVDGRNEK